MTWWLWTLVVIYLLIGAFVFHVVTKMFDEQIEGLPRRPVVMLLFYIWLFLCSIAWPAVFIYWGVFGKKAEKNG